MAIKKSSLIHSYWLKCRISIPLISAFLFFSSYATADREFLSIAENSAVMYDAPSLRAGKLFVANRHLPVEVVVDVEGWSKVRDSSGGLAWVEKKALSPQRYVVVIVPLANIHKSADTNSELVFQAEENIVLEWLDSDSKGWVKVRHSGGQTGYVKINQVWGS